MCPADDATGAAADWLKAVAYQKIEDSPREHAMCVRFIPRMWSTRYRILQAKDITLGASLHRV
ncbi:MAG: hypothetical protein DMG76_10995 [Acidobacteria bacterium]|nr:MAG: hypothetical protein DMG76_10995 [Acidobacteriota bacterium]